MLEKAEEWLAQVNSPQNSDLLKAACAFAEQLAKKQEAPQHEILIEKGLAIAVELQQLHCDSETLSAALIYPAFIQSTPATDVAIKMMGESVVKLLVGTKRMETIDHMPMRTSEFSQQQNFIDNLRKMLLAMADDIRVVLIKLAERLVTLRYSRHQTKILQKNVAQKVMELYAPLANRLGVGQFKWQMEDWAFRYLDSDNYSLISKSLNMRRLEREKYIHKLIEQLENLFVHSHIKKCSISGRAKHIYSIYRKIQRKQVDFSEIYDTSAVRILVPTLEDCYTALGIVHAQWEPISKEFDDYIAKPKDNGYRSIHTAVIGPDGHNVEIQIRTYEMHEEAELGVAAHWKYKEGKKATSNYEEKINWLREVMDWQKEISHDDKWQQIFEDRIYVFTPNGDLIDLEANATPLDFAYRIHTEVGHRCRGAKVNGKMVPLTRTLKTGDRVEILTAKESNPSRDWLTLGYLKTRQAQSKVRHWFHKKDQLQALPPEETKKIETELPFREPTTVSQRKSGIYISIEGMGNLLTQLARCCHPIPGDPIIGYITKGRGITIHHQDCINIKQAIKYRHHRIITVQWGESLPKRYPVNIDIVASDRSGLIRDISNTITDEDVPILGLNSHVNKLDNSCYISLTIEIKNLESLNKIIKRLQQIPSLIALKRKH